MVRKCIDDHRVGVEMPERADALASQEVVHEEPAAKHEVDPVARAAALDVGVLRPRDEPVHAVKRLELWAVVEVAEGAMFDAAAGSYLPVGVVTEQDHAGVRIGEARAAQRVAQVFGVPVVAEQDRRGHRSMRRKTRSNRHAACLHHRTCRSGGRVLIEVESDCVVG